MKTKYTVDYFINFFSKIPDDKWVSKYFRLDDGRCCALGHLHETDDYTTKASNALRLLFTDTLGVSVIQVNDSTVYNGGDIYRLGDTPKERIINALELIKAGVSV